MRKLLRFVLTLLILAGIIVGIGRAVAIRWWRIPSDDPYLEASIAPTLRGGDLILLWRFSPPRFGDLVLCPEPKAPDREVIGRIAGVEQDSVEVQGHNVRINGRGIKTDGDCYEELFTVTDPQTGQEVEQRCDREALGSRLHFRGNLGPKDPPAEVKAVLGDGQVFLLSDNRLYPYDSRDYGPVERSSCKETVVFRLVGAGGFSDVRTRLSFIR